MTKKKCIQCDMKRIYKLFEEKQRRETELQEVGKPAVAKQPVEEVPKKRKSVVYQEQRQEPKEEELRPEEPKEQLQQEELKKEEQPQQDEQ